MEWTLGIFAVMGMIVAVLIALLSMRFVHLDREYDKSVCTCEKRIMEFTARITADGNTEENVQNQLGIQRRLVEIRDRRNNNRKHGCAYDLVSIGIVIGLGMAAVNGAFADNVLPLSIMLAAWLTLPLIHFFGHMYTREELILPSPS